MSSVIEYVSTTTDFTEYLAKMSTYRPAPLGNVELAILEIFAFNKTKSIYQIFKEYNESYNPFPDSNSKPKIAYNNIHKRVKRLLELKLIEELGEHFKRGAIHYNITLYGLVTYVDQTKSLRKDFYLQNKDSILIRSHLLQFFEEETINSIFSDMADAEFPHSRVYEYFRDCCSMAARICKVCASFNISIGLLVQLPSDEIIHSYMLYLGGKQIASVESVLFEIKEYEKRVQAELKSKLPSRYIEGILNRELKKDIDKRDWMQAPYPLDEIYDQIFHYLYGLLKENIKMLTLNMVLLLGNNINIQKRSESTVQKEIDNAKDSSVRQILMDKKFIRLIEDVRSDFDIGIRQFMHFQKIDRMGHIAIKDQLPKKSKKH